MTPINDLRLTPDMRRTRSGSLQQFYKPGHGGWHSTPDVSLDPPEKHIFAELVDDVWCWVNGCPECKGEEPTWRNTYIKCHKHDVCCSCGINRQDLKEIPWGHSKGFKCKPCADKEHKLAKLEALSKMTKTYNEWDYESRDSVTCPYCNYEFKENHNHYESEDVIETCDRCDNKFTVTAVHAITFTTVRIGE